MNQIIHESENKINEIKINYENKINKIENEKLNKINQNQMKELKLKNEKINSIFKGYENKFNGLKTKYEKEINELNKIIGYYKNEIINIRKENIHPNERNNINQNLSQPDYSNERDEYYGEQLFNKISMNPYLTKYENYFPKLVGIFLELEDSVIEKMLENDKYLQENMEECIDLLNGKN